jgi:hypothetical protein
MCVKIAKSDFVILVCLLLCTTWVMNVVLFTIGTNFKKFMNQIQAYGGPTIVVTPSTMQQHAPHGLNFSYLLSTVKRKLISYANVCYHVKLIYTQSYYCNSPCKKNVGKQLQTIVNS